MKQSEITKCLCCGQGVAKSGVHFYRVVIEQMILNPGAIQRQHGLEMSMGAAAGLASIMGPDEDMAIAVSKTSGVVCAKCAMELPLMAAAHSE